MATARERWYQQPVLWLGLAMLAALLAGCIGLITWTANHPDEKVNAGEEVLHVPVAREPPRKP